MTGKLIVLEGSDGSGKSTQFKLLEERLNDLSYDVVSMHFPVYDSFFGKIISKYLAGEFGNLKDVPIELISIAYADDRLVNRSKLQNWLKNDKIVILDRYAESNFAFQAAKIKDPQKRIEMVRFLYDLDYAELKNIKPDAVFYLNIPIEITKKLMEGRIAASGNTLKDIHEEDFEYQAEVIKCYQLLTTTYPDYCHNIDCTRNNELLPKQDISNILLEEVQKILEK